MLHLDLFSGIGGFSLACQWAGIETIGFVEIDKYCQKVLRKHWPDVPIVEDIRDVERIKEIVANATRGRFEQRQVWREQANDLGKVYQNRGGGIAVAESPTLLITAGFPCQPFSVAGKRGGKEDDRYLWPETLAVIKAVKPTWVLLENVTGIINLALDTVLSDLEGAGYATETLIIPACAVNAWHRRDRVWIICHASSNGFNDSQAREGVGPRNQRSPQRQNEVCEPERTSGLWGLDAGPQSRESRQQTEPEGREDSRGGSQEVPIADTTGNRGTTGLSGQDKGHEGKSGEFVNGCDETRDWWAVEPELCLLANGLPPGLVRYLENEPDIPRVAKGIKDRVNKLKALGNSIYWPVAYEIIKVISEEK